MTLGPREAMGRAMGADPAAGPLDSLGLLTRLLLLCHSQEYPLAALAGTACHCGFPTTRFPLHEREDEQLCAQKCSAEELESCGTSRYFVVYQTQVQGERDGAARRRGHSRREGEKGAGAGGEAGELGGAWRSCVGDGGMPPGRFSRPHLCPCHQGSLVALS